MDFDVVDADQFSQLERSSIIGSSFCSAFPSGSVAGEFEEFEVEEEKEKNKMDTVRFIQQMKDMTDHEKKVTETFLKYIYSKN